ncbi:Calcium/calmodulin-dependent 3',5'-cyclic nucleotide phosphodiesterase 1C [Triplophysa tibetana]|uniref:Calcium/calmodulin-dependent 3',5'-cyclic nucleotide phosphodiesterase 1C n=1 Tax=Triplophysa tibetana TaxID=1572043 RepID=A0A5A9PA09_9TELE|nr:Calcium/calmodulin-dependent 3',5'-cyclic nucleotide phosphodiesterase 1C [Triplophysa tibetana]
MGSVTSAFTRSRNTLVKVGSEPQKEGDGKHRTGAVSKQSRKQPLSEVLKTPPPPPSSATELSISLHFCLFFCNVKTLMTARPGNHTGHALSVTMVTATGNSFNVANEDGDTNSRPLARFARSKSQSALWTTLTAGTGKKEKVKVQSDIPDDPRRIEEILADEIPIDDGVVCGSAFPALRDKIEDTLECIVSGVIALLLLIKRSCCSFELLRWYMIDIKKSAFFTVTHTRETNKLFHTVYDHSNIALSAVKAPARFFISITDEEDDEDDDDILNNQSDFWTQTTDFHHVLQNHVP